MSSEPVAYPLANNTDLGDHHNRAASPIEMATTVNSDAHQYEEDQLTSADNVRIVDYEERPHILPQLPPNDTDTDSDNIPIVAIAAPKPWRQKCLAYSTVIILCMVNLLNYMDRFTVSGVLMDIKKEFKINFSDEGLLQTAFICSYMILSPIFGYMGDRCSRKVIMVGGILFWAGVTLGSSFVTKDQFYIFLFLRACVGVGEASYSTIAPTIIADLFIKDQRSNMLAIFYFAIPVGSGLGYIVGANVAEALGNWRWALRVTPGFGVLAVILIVLFVQEPPRGAAEGGSHLRATSWTADIVQLCKNKSFIFTSLGFTCVAFVAGALAFWAPSFMTYSIRAQNHVADSAQVSLIFGIVTCAAGFTGVAIGSQTAKYLRIYNPRADPLVCATGMLLCTPFLFFSLVLSQYNTVVTWVFIFLGEAMLCLNWSVVADIILYVVVPPRRSTAQAFQILLSHALGDAGSPYLVGAISDLIKRQNQTDSMNSFVSLQYALYTTPFACVIGGACFLAAAMTVQRDRARVDMITKKAGPMVIEGALSDNIDNGSDTG